MIKILVIAPPLPEAPQLVTDLQAAGLQVCGRHLRNELVRAAVRLEPTAVLIWEPHPGPELLEVVRLLSATQPLPLLLFTSDVRAEVMEQALPAGIDTWVVNGYGSHRLRPLVQQTLVRHRQQRALRDELTELQRRLDERKLIDRAKGILMTARQVSEEEAFRLLRSASMHAKQRIGQTSQQVIDAAHYAEAINRAGRLRMLSQRIVKLYALAFVGVEAAGARALMLDSCQQVEQILQALGKSLSLPTFGDLLGAVEQTWAGMKPHLSGTPSLDHLLVLDGQAETLLAEADRLTGALEGAGLAPTLHLINLSGRQRMLAQRLAKQALLGSLQPQGGAPSQETALAFEQALTHLRGLPLSTELIRSSLAAAELAWQRMLAGAGQPASTEGRLALAGASEELLVLFDRLTGAYEQSMQLLMG